jgi:SAM-dependent methyltransferase
MAEYRERRGRRALLGEYRLTAVGYIEVCTDTLVSGWAWDSGNPEKRLEVAIKSDNEILAQVTAQVYREDLRIANIGDGGHGFAYTPPRPIDTKAHSVAAFIVGTDVQLRRLHASEEPPPTGSLGPIAPEPLRTRVAGTPDAQWFDQSGAMTLDEWIRLLALHQRRLAEFECIVEWGCGCGRVLRHLAAQLTEKQRLIGIDVDAEAIAWLGANYPNVPVLAVAETPPTPLADASADLIVSHSVFTHLPEAVASAWLDELARILKPGGLLITTFHGKNVIEAAKPWLSIPEFNDIMDNYGFYHFPARTNAESTLPDYYGAAFHNINFITRRWSKWFNIRSWVPAFALSYQDSLLLEKR